MTVQGALTKRRKMKQTECNKKVSFEVYLPNGWHEAFEVPCGHYGDGKKRYCELHKPKQKEIRNN